MKKTRFQKLAALLLALLMLISGGTLSVFADSSTVTSKEISDYTEKLSSNSYDVYRSSSDFEETARANGEIVIKATDYETADAKGVHYDESLDALYTDADSAVTWKFNSSAKARYAIKMEYYSIYTGKSTSIEREMKLNGETPFTEASALSISKNWVTEFIEGRVNPTKKNTAEMIAAELTEAGLEAKIVTEEGETFVSVKAPTVWTGSIGEKIDKYDIRFFETDKSNDELHTSAKQVAAWDTYYFKDSGGIYEQYFEFVVKAGENTLTLVGVGEPVAIKSITLYPLKDYITYEEYLAKYTGVAAGTDKVKIEGEFNGSASTSSVYPQEDRTSALTSPADTSRTILNTIGGEKWETAGQWVEYTFEVNNSGMYDIVSRIRQNILGGMYVCRSLYLYSDGAAEGSLGYYDGIPFEECTRLRYDYNTKWQVTSLTDGEQDFLFYLEAGVKYTMKLEVSLGSMGDIVVRVEDILDSINKDYLQIIKLTGTSPDAYRDYGFARTMPEVLKDFVRQSKALRAVSDELKKAAGSSSSNAATLDKVADLLELMGKKPNKIASKLTTLKSHIGTIGTFLSDAKTQPLQIDYIVIQGAEAKHPKANANFFSALWHEISNFFQSFRRNYDSANTSDEDAEKNIEVWIASARDQYNVVRRLITDGFQNTEDGKNINANLKLVSASTLLPSILAKMGPDVYLGLDQGTIINYAIRGALLPIEDMEGFDEKINDFNHSAIITMQIEDSDGVLHTYGLPESQTFPMMFIRIDILNNLGIEIPKTWGDIYSAITVLQANNMQIGYTMDYKIFLYQMGGTLFADNGMRINLDSKIGLEAFEKTCDFFTQYSFPYTYDAANRFRTGEMPIIIADYVALYNTLKVFATEIDGLWTFVPLPGMETTDEDGNTVINNCSISTVTASVMVANCRDRESAWKFMKWFTGADAQSGFANEMVAILGDSAKQATANRDALSMMTWTTEEYKEVILQFNNLAAIPNYPGSYYIDRYTKFAFLEAYNNSANPVTSLQSYIKQINEEIIRKRREFDLEILEIGETLASKRAEQAEEKMSAIEKSTNLTEAEAHAILMARSAAKRSDETLVRSAILEMQTANATLFAEVISLLTDVADALATY